MKRHSFTLAVLALLVAVGITLRPARNPGEYDVNGFGRLPTLVNGRLKPLDTVARTSLLMMQGRQRVVTPAGRSQPPIEWLLDMLFRPAEADRSQTFEIVHPDVLALLNLTPEQGAGGKRFSMEQLLPGMRELDRQARLADGAESASRTTFQQAVTKLRDAVVLYQRLQSCAAAADLPDFYDRLDQVAKSLATLTPGAPGHGGSEGKLLLEMATVFNTLDSFGYLRLIPAEPGQETTAWKSVGAAWTSTLADGKVSPSALAYAQLGRAWSGRQPEAFNAAVAAQRARMERDFPAVMRRSAVEVSFNTAEPFYTSSILYVLGFLLALTSWLRWSGPLSRFSFAVVACAFVLATAGIVTRMWLESRPPVTNLYSSALFVGWGAVALCLILERIYRNGVGSVAGGVVGFSTLLIAHHLALGGDTMEMMRAVLDSNFWLATHVVTIAVGYSATFLAGFLGVIYLLRSRLTRSLDKTTANALIRMIYGIVCFATLFSFVGTILGGIWADQSWGRFWGWDPKENGALLIVMWNSILLHARWGGYVRDRGLAALAVFGNIVTAWSWFGVNMLGVGLHSYGFMDAAFWWLVGFVISQLLVIIVAGLPARSPALIEHGGETA
jgi:ABC-type transport system involved in cytochrome c biogenesis permease subunit